MTERRTKLYQVSVTRHRHIVSLRDTDQPIMVTVRDDHRQASFRMYHNDLRAVLLDARGDELYLLPPFAL